MKNTAGIGRIASSAAVALPPASATVQRHSVATIAPPKAGNARTDLNAALTQRPDTAIRSAANSATDEMRTALAKLASDYLSGSSRINPFKTLEGTLLMGVIANTKAAFTEDERRAAFVEAESRGILPSGPQNNAISAYTTTQSSITSARRPYSLTLPSTVPRSDALSLYRQLLHEVIAMDMVGRNRRLLASVPVVTTGPAR